MTNDWVARQEYRRRERERRQRARRVRLWAIESNTPHEPDCACWDCVLGLVADVARHQAEMRARREGRRRRMVPR